MKYIIALLLLIVSTTWVAAKISNGTITLGISLSREPEGTILSRLGVDIYNGLNFWLSTINGTSNSIRGQQYKFELVVKEDFGGVGNVTKNYRELLEDENVDYLLGPLNTAFSRAAADITEENQRLFLGTSAGSALFARNKQYALSAVAPGEKYIFWQSHKMLSYSDPFCQLSLGIPYSNETGGCQ